MSIYNNNKRKSRKVFSSVLAVCMAITLLSAIDAQAQLTNIQSIYFQNQYLANPALAGLENQLNLNMDYHQQWTSVPGSPRLTTFTADYNSGNKVGLGLNIYNDQAGLINRTRIMATYAYHITLSGKGDKLHFGVSLGFNDANINYGNVVGDIGDLAVAEFNKHGLYADGDLGIAYTSNKFNIQVAIPNLKRTFFKSALDDVDVEATNLYAALSYKIQLSNDYSYSIFNLEPKVAYRSVTGFNSIFDAGFNLYRTTFENNYQLNLQGMYHSDNRVSMGLGADLANIGILFSYSYSTGQLSNYANNTFELGVNLKFKKKVPAK